MRGQNSKREGKKRTKIKCTVCAGYLGHHHQHHLILAGAMIFVRSVQSLLVSGFDIAHALETTMGNIQITRRNNTNNTNELTNCDYNFENIGYCCSVCAARNKCNHFHIELNNKSFNHFFFSFQWQTTIRWHNMMTI